MTSFEQTARQVQWCASPRRTCSPVAPPRVAMLDPSAFTIPYDAHLCRALGGAGAEVTLLTRPMREGEYYVPAPADGSEGGEPPYRTVEHFYRLSEGLPAAAAPLKLAVKGIEHVWNMASLCRSLGRWRPDVIHFQWTVLPVVDGCFLGRLRAIAPCVLTVHDTNAFLAPSSRLQKAGWRRALRRFDRLIVHTQAGRRALIAHGVAEAKVLVIPHGVFSYAPRCEVAGAKPSDDETCLLLAFGAIKPYKGVDVLVRALAELPSAARRRTRLLIAGNPRVPEPELRGLASACGVEDLIEWDLRFIPDDEIPALFARCNAVVFPYREIDASGALMTALPYGKAIVASRLGLFAELLRDGETALLVPPGDPAALAAAIRRLVENPAEARAMGRRAAALAQDVCSWERIAEMTLAAYREAIEQREGDGRDLRAQTAERTNWSPPGR